MQIIIDTNMLIDSIKFKIDIFSIVSEYGSPIIPDICLDELKKLSIDMKEAGIILDILHKKTINIVETDKKIRINDKKISDLAIKNNYAVATNDKELLKVLKNNKIKTFRLKQHRYLVEN